MYTWFKLINLPQVKDKSMFSLEKKKTSVSWITYYFLLILIIRHWSKFNVLIAFKEVVFVITQILTNNQNEYFKTSMHYFHPLEYHFV